MAIVLSHNTRGQIETCSIIVVQYQLRITTGLIDANYSGELNVVLANLHDQPYRVEKGDRIAHLIIEKINIRELQGVAQFEDTKRGAQGFWKSNTTMDQEVKGQRPKSEMKINKILERACGEFDRRGDMTGNPRWDEVDNQIPLEAINFRTELAIKNKKK